MEMSTLLTKHIWMWVAALAGLTDREMDCLRYRRTNRTGVYFICYTGHEWSDGETFDQKTFKKSSIQKAFNS